MIRILISACLLGEPVRYDGRHRRRDDTVLEDWRQEGRLVPVCPERAGGLTVPRPPAEILAGDGYAVLQGRAWVRRADGDDVSEAFIAGARYALEVALAQDVGLAVLTDRSPSCASHSLYDGSFRGLRRPGLGVTAALLQSHGIQVFSEHELAAAAACLERLESAGRQRLDCRN